MVKKEKKKIIMTTGKRKGAVARARFYDGNGKIKINSQPLEYWRNEFLRMRIREPIVLAGDVSMKVDISVNVIGGGFSAQTEAVRMSIAKGLVAYSKSDSLKKKYIQYDRNLLVYDPRRTEPHKPSRSSSGPRRHKQRSKR